MDLLKKFRQFKETSKIKDDNGYDWTYMYNHKLIKMDEDHSPTGGYIADSVAEAFIVLIDGGYIEV